MLSQKNQEIARLQAIYEGLLTNSGVTLIEDQASLLDAHTVRVGEQQYLCERILQAVVKKFAVFMETFQGYFHGYDLFEGITDFLQLRLIFILIMKKPAIKPDCFLSAIAGYLFKGFVGIDNQVVFLVRVGEGNTIDGTV